MPATPPFKILILSSDSVCSEKISTIVEHNSDYDCQIDIDTQCNSNCKTADLIIIGSLNINFSQVFYSAKPSSEVVLCTSESDLNAVSPSELRQFSEILIKSSNDIFVEARILHLIEKVIKNRRTNLERIWLDTLINNIPEMIWFKDKKGEHLKVNDHFCKIVEKEKSDVEGRGHYYIWDITPEDYSQGEYICLESEDVVMEAKETRVFDETVKVNAGMLRLKTYKAPVFSEDGDIAGTLGYAQDVTELSKQTFVVEDLINCFPFPILLLDKNNNIKETNGYYKETFESVNGIQDAIGCAMEDWLDDFWEILDYTDNLSDVTASIRLNDQEQEFSLLLSDLSNKFEDNSGSLLICLPKNKKSS